MVSNDILSLYVDTSALNNINIRNFYNYIYNIWICSDYIFYDAGVMASQFEINSCGYKDVFKISYKDYEQNRREFYNLDSVIYKTKFDYTSCFKDFDYGNNNRNEDFDGFKYKTFDIEKYDVTNPTIMCYMMSTGINVIPKVGSLAEDTLKVYKNIARNIFSDSMSDYEKIVACNQYFNNYMVIDISLDAATSNDGKGSFSCILEELPFNGTINCRSGCLPRMLYALEGIQLYRQMSWHAYDVFKFENKWYVSDHLINYWIFQKNKNYNPLRGYLDCDYISYDTSHGKYKSEMIKNKAFGSPGIELEKYHYNV